MTLQTGTVNRYYRMETRNDAVVQEMVLFPCRFIMVVYISPTRASWSTPVSLLNTQRQHLLGRVHVCPPPTHPAVECGSLRDHVAAAADLSVGHVCRLVQAISSGQL